jgi:hypothetical protein
LVTLFPGFALSSWKGQYESESVRMIITSSLRAGAAVFLFPELMVNCISSSIYKKRVKLFL